MLQRAIHSMEIQNTLEGNSQWVQLFPLGAFSGYDGRGPYSIDDAEKVIELTSANSIGRDLPVDYGHQSEFAEKNGQPAPAAGWMKEFAVRADGLYARIEWTDKAMASIQAKEFRYISPVYFHTPTGQVKRIISAGLTNQPNLQMKALSSQQHTHHDKGHDMDLQKLLIKLFGLADNATAEQISAHAQQLINSDTEVKAAMSSMGGMLSLKDNATADDLIKAVQSAITSDQTKSDPDPAKFVPMTVFKELQGTVKALQSTNETAAATLAVDKALADKKITPAQVDWAKSYHQIDPKGFGDYIKAAPALSLDAVIIDNSDPDKRGKSLSVEEKAVCSQLGVTEEDFIKSRGDQS
ncbi:MAG: phage protease [Emcibacter sp.]|nr:phage protease [Emcibacter sp.]